MPIWQKTKEWSTQTVGYIRYALQDNFKEVPK